MPSETLPRNINGDMGNGDTGNGASIEVRGLSLDFPLYHSARSLRRMVLSRVAGRTGADAQDRVVVKALRDVSFSLKSGDRLGLVGTNGAGKTTLLRTLAGIYEPYHGTVQVRGSIDAMLDAGLGMNPNLTGRENVRLRGLYNGMDTAAIEQLQHDVAAFADLDEFIDLPVRIYSAGMVVRLGFAMATSIRPQVLLMDEWFLAGDANFMEKARARLEDMVRGAEILVLSTHSVGVLLEWCSRLIWMDQGRIRDDGPTEEVLERYLGHPPR
jgi:lipopolysaccharide transport system ATP-binding protein